MSLFAVALATASLGAALPAPLVAYLTSADTNNRSLQLTRAQLAEQKARVQVALASLTPTFTVSGGYTRNQYNSVIAFPAPGTGGFQSVTIQPYDQLQGTLSLNLPLLNIGAYAALDEARHVAAGAKAADLASRLEVQLSVAQTYYQVVAAQGIAGAADRALKTAQDALAVSQARKDAGSANQLTVDRAKVDVARAQQQVADARRALGVAQRSLETLSGKPVAEPLPLVEAVGQVEGVEASYVDSALQQRPEVKQAREALDQSGSLRDQAWAALAPTLTGQAQEHLSNYSGFTGHEGYWTLGVNLAWTVDFVGSPAGLKAANAIIAENQARLAQAQDTVRDDVHTAWLTVQADRTHVEETAAEVQSAQEALKLTQEQFSAGTATSLDLSQAERDAFTAEANAAQASSDFATALLSLTKASGTPLLEASK